MTYKIDPGEIRRALELLAPPVFEIRALHATVNDERRSGTYSGYFDREHIDDAIAAVARITKASATFFTPNACKSDLLGRACNRARIVSDKEPTTSDRDIERRKWLLVDIDSTRSSQISATLAEKAAAEGLITAIDNWLWEQGFPAGVIGDSGNGAHLMLPLDLPADDKGFCKRLLAKLAEEFDTNEATVDLTTFNAARIWKLPGTLVCKGDNCPQIGREWRMAKILQVCNEVPSDA